MKNAFGAPEDYLPLLALFRARAEVLVPRAEGPFLFWLISGVNRFTFATFGRVTFSAAISNFNISGAIRFSLPILRPKMSALFRFNFATVDCIIFAWIIFAWTTFDWTIFGTTISNVTRFNLTILRPNISSYTSFNKSIQIFGLLIH
ncbi:unnamed protein product [Clonostachys rosea f. rosea IK726]|uniref:Uncharacterized protein n=1 Tax=Clonostachys rosea f. rosea IK726 TaxID=1349383 RepID=A0ACA9TET7_BIOOC|nr:unnamed protein product [Clonostachys rosea f. rosea IK726]